MEPSRHASCGCGPPALKPAPCPPPSPAPCFMHSHSANGSPTTVRSQLLEASCSSSGPSRTRARISPFCSRGAGRGARDSERGMRTSEEAPPLQGARVSGQWGGAHNLASRAGTQPGQQSQRSHPQGSKHGLLIVHIVPRIHCAKVRSAAAGSAVRQGHACRPHGRCPAAAAASAALADAAQPARQHRNPAPASHVRADAPMASTFRFCRVSTYRASVPTGLPGRSATLEMEFCEMQVRGARTAGSGAGAGLHTPPAAACWHAARRAGAACPRAAPPPAHLDADGRQVGGRVCGVQGDQDEDQEG